MRWRMYIVPELNIVWLKRKEKERLGEEWMELGLVPLDFRVTAACNDHENEIVCSGGISDSSSRPSKGQMFFSCWGSRLRTALA